MADDLYRENPEDRPAAPPPPPPPEDDFRLPTSGPGRTAVTAYGVATLVLAGVLLLSGGACGVASVLCYASADSALHPPPAAPGAGPNNPANAVPAAAAACGNAVGGMVLIVLAFILAAAMLLHLALSGGQFTAGVGVLRRRPWARILAVVLSILDVVYGGYLLYQSIAAAVQGGGEAESVAGWLVLAGVVGLFLVLHAILTWVVMFHPACAGEFPTAPRVRPRRYYDE